MKMLFGWIGLMVLAPFIVCGAFGYLISDACVYGWHWAEEALESWDD